MNKERRIVVAWAIGILALVLATGGIAQADFTFGTPVNLKSVVPALDPAHDAIGCLSYFYCNRFILSRRAAGAAGTDPCEHASGKSSLVRCGRARC